MDASKSLLSCGQTLRPETSQALLFESGFEAFQFLQELLERTLQLSPATRVDVLSVVGDTHQERAL